MADHKALIGLGQDNIGTLRGNDERSIGQEKNKNTNNLIKPIEFNGFDFGI